MHAMTDREWKLAHTPVTPAELSAAERLWDWIAPPLREPEAHKRGTSRPDADVLAALCVAVAEPAHMREHLGIVREMLVLTWKHLPRRTQRVLEQRLRTPRVTRRVIGAEFGISVSRVAHVEHDALRRLRGAILHEAAA